MYVIIGYGYSFSQHAGRRNEKSTLLELWVGLQVRILVVGLSILICLAKKSGNHNNATTHMRQLNAVAMALIVLCSVVPAAVSLNVAGHQSSKSATCTVSTCTRGDFFARIARATAIIVPATDMLGVDKAIAAGGSSVSADDEIQILHDGSEALGSLLANWERATVDCTYADVPRDLLEAKNKELLLEKAKTSALFDKSASVVSCRKNPRIVRDYLGATGKGPLVNADKRFLKRAVAGRVDPDDLDMYYDSVEAFSQAISKASSLSYMAGMSDLDSINTFAKGDEGASGDSASLEQARKAIIEAKDAMDKALNVLTTADS